MKTNMQQTSLLLCSLLLTLATGCATPAADKHARNMASSCAACHGTNGHSAGGAPVLAGLDKGYFVAQMKEMKSGARPTTVMGQHAKGYSEAEIEQLAGYFAAQK